MDAAMMEYERTTRATQTATIADLRTAFELIQNPDDWKAPIAAWIDGSNYQRFAEAVEFYTATQLRVVGGPQPLTGYIYVEADGYRRGPAGDN